ncbi:MAG: hypothetical protein KBS81_00480, partial [Spirochaetales bacterium]|nr:hypothetical protein [Candidatus Physcosoma equi]
MFNKKDPTKNQYMLKGSLRRRGYDWWWHSFTGRNVRTGEEKPFFIEFFLMNPSLGGEKPVLGQEKENQEKGIKPSYLMVKAGCWGKDKMQLHRFFPWSEVQIKEGAPFSVTALDCFASDTVLKGSVTVTEEDAALHPEWMCDSGSMTFDLKIEKRIAFNVGYGASAFFRVLNAFEMYWHAEGMKSLYSGTIVANGETYLVEKSSSYGYADKNWGGDFTTPWVWLSSNNLKSSHTGRILTNSVFDIGGGRPKVFGISLNRKLLGVFYYEGKEYDYNFSHFWKGVHTVFSFEEEEDSVHWHIQQENWKSRMITDIHCRKEDMLFVNYEAPDGKKRHNKLWNGGNGTG